LLKNSFSVIKALVKGGNALLFPPYGLVSESQGSTLTPTLSLGEGEQYSYIPSERTENYYKTRPCSMLVYTAAKIIE